MSATHFRQFLQLEVRVHPSGDTLLLAKFDNSQTVTPRAYHHRALSPVVAALNTDSDHVYRHYIPGQVNDRHVAAVLAEYFAELAITSNLSGLYQALMATPFIHDQAGYRTIELVAQLRKLVKNAVYDDDTVAPKDRENVKIVCRRLSDHAQASLRAIAWEG